MRDLYKIMDQLVEKRVWFCWQSQDRSTFYNISVDDIKGKTHYINHYDLDDVERDLKVLWGHLIEETPKAKGMPLPC